MKELYGNREIKFIVSFFGDPVKRVYSWYWNMVREGRENLSFSEAILAEEERLETHRQTLDDRGTMLYAYFKGGCYASLLQPFLELFPRDSFLFLLQEDLNDVDGVTAKVFDFIGVDNSVKVRGSSSNPAAMPRVRALHRLLKERSPLTAACDDIDPRDLALEHIVLDGVRVLHGRLFRASIYAPTRLWTNLTARRCEGSGQAAPSPFRPSPYRA